jgi:uncharacterized membrane protein YccF (DUF307 family)
MISKRDLKADQNKLWLAFGFLIRIIYFPFGLVLSVITVFQIAGLFLSVVGIPVALVLAKSLGTYFNPVNKVCVPIEVEDEIHRWKARRQVDKHAF